MVLNVLQIGPHELPHRLTGESYLQFLRNELPILLEEVPLDIRQEMWLQHDGAPAHFSRVVREYLDETFSNRWIGRGGWIRWPARSPDLNPLDFFLWGHFKAIIYGRTLPANRNDLMDRINMAAATVTEELLERCWENLIVRAHKCIEVGGGHFEHLL